MLALSAGWAIACLLQERGTHLHGSFDNPTRLRSPRAQERHRHGRPRRWAIRQPENMALPLSRPDCRPHPCHDDQIEPGTGPFEVSVSEGRPLPLGVHDCCDGFNFALFSWHATRVALLLFADADSAEPFAVIDLDPTRHRTGDIWHALVAIRTRVLWAARATGTSAVSRSRAMRKRLIGQYANRLRNASL